MKASRCCGTVAIWTGWLGEQRTENREMSSGLEVQCPSRRDLMRQCGKVALGVAGTGLLAPAQQAAPEVTYPFKTWQLNGQDAYIFADPATKTYYRTTTGDRKSTRLNSSHLGISYA